jgi:peptidoglycan/xylan/chitin deacetylase (PgdA/CDA1 family)
VPDMNSKVLISNFFSALSMSLKPNRLSILMFHRVMDNWDYLRPDEPDVAEFDRQMRLVAEHFYPLALSEGMDRMRRGNLPPGAVCVTFDDGYADNAVNALPILQKWGIPATIFIATDFLDGGVMWNDAVIESIRCAGTGHIDLSKMGLPHYDLNTPDLKINAASDILNRIKYFDQQLRAAIVENLCSIVGNKVQKDIMLTKDALLELKESGIEIGGHTKSHPILSKLQDQAAIDEIEEGREQLTRILGGDVVHFAYPNGKYGVDFEKRHVAMVRDAGYQYAFTTDRGVATAQTDTSLIPRFTPWDKNNIRYVSRLWLNALGMQV